jgi:hypothetical protein
MTHFKLNGSVRALAYTEDGSKVSFIHENFACQLGSSRRAAIVHETTFLNLKHSSARRTLYRTRKAECVVYGKRSVPSQSRRASQHEPQAREPRGSHRPYVSRTRCCPCVDDCSIRTGQRRSRDSGSTTKLSHDIHSHRRVASEALETQSLITFEWWSRSGLRGRWQCGDHGDCPQTSSAAPANELSNPHFPKEIPCFCSSLNGCAGVLRQVLLLHLRSLAVRMHKVDATLHGACQLRQVMETKLECPL